MPSAMCHWILIALPAHVLCSFIRVKDEYNMLVRSWVFQLKLSNISKSVKHCSLIRKDGQRPLLRNEQNLCAYHASLSGATCWFSENNRHRVGYSRWGLSVFSLGMYSSALSIWMLFAATEAVAHRPIFFFVSVTSCHMFLTLHVRIDVLICWSIHLHICNIV